MNNKHLLLFFFTLLLTISCTPSQTQQTSNRCTAYEGTWKGIISDSGSLEVTRYVNYEPVTTHNPFTAQYDIEMTLKATDEWDLSQSSSSCSYFITHLKVSHPIFNCVQGCTPIPISDKGGISSWLYIKEDGFGAFQIAFPNGATISAFTEENMLKVSADGKKMELYIPEETTWQTIGSVKDGDEYRTIETDNCKRLGGEGSCYLEYINKNTIILNKID